MRGKVRYKIKNTSDKTLWLRKNEKSITIQGKKIKNIIIEKSQTSEVDLLEYINRSNNFFVNFEDIELVYYSRTLFSVCPFSRHRMDQRPRSLRFWCGKAPLFQLYRTI